MTPEQAKREATQVTVVGMCLDISLSLLKIFGGLFAQSFALVTDGIHSLTDAITDIFVLIVTRISQSAPDQEHPFGHGRFEALGTITMALVFFVTAAVLLFDSFSRLNSGVSLSTPAWWSLLIAAISIASKEWIYHFTMRVANKLNSSLLKANAWHSRSDAISSIAVFIGLIGAQLGYLWMDTLAAIFVALLIAKIAWELCCESLKELVDTAIPLAEQLKIQQSLLNLAGIHRVHGLRSRRSGGKVILEVELAVDPRISVSEGHQLGEAASEMLTTKFPEINDVIVHIDTDNEAHCCDPRLPLRPALIQSIEQAWPRDLPIEAIEKIDLHYLNKNIEIDIYLSKSLLQKHSLSHLSSLISQALGHLDSVSNIRLYSHLADLEMQRDIDAKCS